jgi:hypothetical protein
LVAWAKAFHAQGETWILEGALQTLWWWHQDPESRRSLDIGRFHSSCCADSLSSDEEQMFTLEHAGWSPQTQTWPRFHSSIQ